MSTKIHFNVGDVDIFSFAQCVEVTQLVSGFLSEEIAPCVAIDAVCQWEEVHLGS